MCGDEKKIPPYFNSFGGFFLDSKKIAFQHVLKYLKKEENWLLPFLVSIFSLRDNQVLTLCKLGLWWRHSLNSHSLQYRFQYISVSIRWISFKLCSILLFKTFNMKKYKLWLLWQLTGVQAPNHFFSFPAIASLFFSIWAKTVYLTFAYMTITDIFAKLHLIHFFIKVEMPKTWN